MKGDFSRDTFDPANNFSRVLMQQGRVQLDADWNEQAAILLHHMQALAADMIGPYGGPKNKAGFLIATVERAGSFLLSNGHYYVDGILCENVGYQNPQTKEFIHTWDYLSQPYYPLDKDKDKLAQGTWLVYLDVWERHLTYLEMEDADGGVISIREAALGGPDTATRAQVVWQVKTTDKMSDGKTNILQAIQPGITGAEFTEKYWPGWPETWQPSYRGLLKARVIQPKPGPDDPCITPPDSGYRGAENQLYRVEIHNGGTADAATFKWSRENGAVVFPIRQVAGKSVTLENAGRDARFGLQIGDWVEIVDDTYTLHNRAEPLLQVDMIDYDANVVMLKEAPASPVGQDPQKHPLLRRWDQRASDTIMTTKDGLEIVEGDQKQNWIELENGIQIQFQIGGTYRTGDYWLIAARTATGDVEWPGPGGDPAALGPRGIEHHYAPLGLIMIDAAGGMNLVDCRRLFKQLWEYQ